MAKGQYLSKHQQGIVRRHYQFADARTGARLQEIVSDLALATEEKTRDRLWRNAAEWLAKAGAPPERTAKVVQTRDVAALATLVGSVVGSGKP
ncbi:MAG TPA: hypothetical protein VD963_02355 [Phycisphaerales bacterium]|nr:hypothetical protein [Phycisphaerales bacterium]